MAFNTGAGSKLIAPGLRKVLFQAYESQPKEYTRIFNQLTSSRNYEEDLEFVGLGTMPEKAEGTATVYSTPTQGAVKRYTHVSFGSGFRVTREMQDDDLYNVVKGRGGKMAKELGKGAAYVREVRAANVLNNGFATTGGFTKNGTADYLFTATHTCIGGGADLDNLSAADLSQAALEDAIISFMTLTDENGIPIVKTPKYLVVPPQLIMVATELTGSEYKPGTANNDINTLTKFPLEPIVNHYLTDSDAWFVLAAPGDHDLNFFTRTDLEFSYDDDFDTGDMKIKAFQRFSVGYGDWRGTFASPGV